MDFNKVKIIKNYTDQIRGFRNLDKYKNLSNNKFSIEMKLLFPEFSKNNNLIFDSIINNQDLEFLDIMFHKLDEINMEYKSRKNELVYLCSKVDDIKALFEVNKDMNKEKLITYIENSSAEFINKYPVIIDRLLDFRADMAVVNDSSGSEICRFTRSHGGLYLAKMKLRAPTGFSRPE